MFKRRRNRSMIMLGHGSCAAGVLPPVSRCNTGTVGVRPEFCGTPTNLPVSTERGVGTCQTRNEITPGSWASTTLPLLSTGGNRLDYGCAIHQTGRGPRGASAVFGQAITVQRQGTFRGFRSTTKTLTLFLTHVCRRRLFVSFAVLGYSSVVLFLPPQPVRACAPSPAARRLARICSRAFVVPVP